ncbi:SusC/RagA family TonB-linked outer membrane protein [Sinomicrobium weinanense]|uniref:TonB-dependent receptor n=1 Tax=Sinomicrobium weinanense TaxID=2842200 RepID=A0A926JQ15_9FLAO|nr:TonB-dependent receptor [Sinomicrobium weinanense]MBC9795213.1 TonB-dependent receptor [Sinomicrobium weinanense]MBU3121990.1 TonB-dependent receptor [Sinomicrobium weinanense]
MYRLKSIIGSGIAVMGLFLPVHGMCCNTVKVLSAFGGMEMTDNGVPGTNEIDQPGTVQGWEVTGEVLDKAGVPLPGATIMEKGTSNGTTTDFDGNFSLTVSDEDAILLISYIGYITQEVAVKSQKQIEVTLEEDAQKLDEVVVVGYGTQKKKDLTGAITSVNVADMPPSANTNVVQAMRGQTAGLNVDGGSMAGSEPSFSIRGNTSLSASNGPLIVLDGIIYNGTLSSINVTDIEKIDILKGASAAAVYGSRSANGVVLITTKKGKRGERPRINFSTYAGLQGYTNNPVKYMNGEQYAKRLVDYNYFQGLYGWYGKQPTGPGDQGGKPVHPGYNEQSILNVLKSDDERANYLAGNEINWIDEVTRTTPISNYNLSISGAGEGFSYYVSGSSTNQKGVLVGDQFKRNTLNSKVEGDILNWVTVGANMLYSYQDLSGLEAPLSSALNASPLASKFDENGMYPTRFNQEFLMAHPLRYEYVDNDDIRKNLFATAYVKIEVPGIAGLNYNFNYSNNTTTRKNRTFYPSTVEEASAVNGRGKIENNERTNWIYNHILNYRKNIAEKHDVDITLVYTRDHTSWDGSSMDANRFTSEVLGFNDMGLAEQYTIGSGAWEESTLGYMARINYGFDSRYLLTGTYRRDGYSGFGRKNKFVDFFALSAAWNIAEETFMKGTSEWLDLLKLRVSHGENGNQGIGAYSSLSRLSARYYAFGSGSAIGTLPSSMGNPGLSWETTVSTNIGLDYSFLNNRISGSVEVYKADTKNVLVERSLPGATGYKSVWANIGEIANKGVEVELSTVNLDGPLRWESRFVFSLNRNKIIELYGDGRDDIGNGWFIGEPIGAIYDYKRTGGVWSEEELYNGETLDDFYPGQFKLADLNGDNRITADDRTIVGNTEPKYRFSISNSLSYNNLSLSFLINSVQGGNGYYIGDLKYLLEATSSFDYAQRANQPAIRENWTPDNGVDNAPAIYNYPSVSSGNYQDRSFVRLQDLSISYRFNQNILDTLKAQDLQVYVSGQNLYTWTNWEGYDPESGNSLMIRNISLGLRLSY